MLAALSSSKLEESVLLCAVERLQTKVKALGIPPNDSSLAAELSHYAKLMGTLGALRKGFETTGFVVKSVEATQANTVGKNELPSRLASEAMKQAAEALGQAQRRLIDVVAANADGVLTSASDVIQLLTDAACCVESAGAPGKEYKESAMSLVKSLKSIMDELIMGEPWLLTSVIEGAVKAVNEAFAPANREQNDATPDGARLQLLGLLKQRITAVRMALKEVAKLTEMAGEALNAKLPDLEVAAEAAATHALEAAMSSAIDLKQKAIDEVKALGALLSQAVQQELLLETLKAVREVLLPEPSELSGEGRSNAAPTGEGAVGRHSSSDHGLPQVVQKELSEAVQGLKLHAVSELAEEAQTVRCQRLPRRKL